MSARRKLLFSTASVGPPGLDPIIGLEVIRRTLGLSKATFYGEISSTLPVITLSARRRGVRRSAYEAWLEGRTRQPLSATSTIREV